MSDSATSLLKSWVLTFTVLIFIGIITFISGEAMFNAYEQQKTAPSYPSISIKDAETNTIKFDLEDQKGINIDFNKIVMDNFISLYLRSGYIYKLNFYNGDQQNIMVISANISAPFFVNETQKWIIQKIPEYIVEQGYESISITPLKDIGKIAISNVKTLNNPDFSDEKFRNANIIDFEIKQLEISIKDRNFEKIKQKRDEALTVGILLSSDSDYVPAKIKADGKTYNTDIRLKGDWTDHLAGRQWSFRIDVDNGECIYGMDKFSIQAPWTRGGLWEPLLYEMYKERGGVTLRYNFADVFINGTYYGVYAVEEFIGKRVIENSQKREGPIIRLDEELLWEQRAKFDPLTYGRDEVLNAVISKNVTVFSEKKTVQSDSLSGLAAYAITSLNKFREGTLSAEEVFDLDLVALRFAISDIVGGTHGEIWHNFRFYLNPITGLLETIPFDAEPDPYWIKTFTFDLNTFPVKQLFNDEKFIQLYVKHLKELSTTYVENLTNNRRIHRNDYITILRYDHDVQFFPEDVDRRIKRIQRLFEDRPPLVLRKVSNGRLNLEIRNNSHTPIEIIDITFNGISLVGLDHLPIRLDSINGDKSGTKVLTKVLVDNTNYSINVKYKNVISGQTRIVETINPEIAFFVAGHAYGEGSVVPDGLHGPLITYLETVGADPKMKFGVFTGDFVQVDNDEQYAQFLDSVKKTGLPFYANPGNHDIGIGGERFDRLIGPRFQAFDFQGSVFIFLDPTYPDQNIPPAQIRMIKDILERNPEAKNVFVFSHYLIWWEADDDRFNYFSPNWDYGRKKHTNFQTEVLPLFDKFSGKTYFIAGDVGKTDASTGIFYEEYDGYCYIASGMGNYITDNVLEFYIASNGEVIINLVSLSDENPYLLGGIEKFRYISEFDVLSDTSRKY